MGPVAWGKAFKAYTRLIGVEEGSGARNDRTSTTLGEVASEAGVSENTARRRMSLASDLEAYPRISEPGEFRRRKGVEDGDVRARNSA